MAVRKKEELLQNVTDQDSARQALQDAVYEKSPEVQQAQDRLEAHMAQKPGAYVSGYQEKIDGMLDRILNRDGFSYDFSTDPMYQTYRQQYTHQGRLAMQDSMAQAAGLTGGYGSSYGIAAGSQAYQGWMNRLNERVPELYQVALDRYDREGKSMQTMLEQMMGLEKADRQQYESQMDQYYQGLKQYADLADSAYQKDYGAYQDLLDSLVDLRDYYAKQDQQAFQRKQDELAHALAVEKLAQSARQWEEKRADDREKWQAQLGYKQSALAYRKEKDQAKAKKDGSDKTTATNQSAAHKKNSSVMTKKEFYDLNLQDRRTGNVDYRKKTKKQKSQERMWNVWGDTIQPPESR